MKNGAWKLPHGAAYYDHLLAPLQPPPYLVAGAFDLQVIDDVPMESHDKRLDRIITEGERHQVADAVRRLAPTRAAREVGRGS